LLDRSGREHSLLLWCETTVYAWVPLSGKDVMDRVDDGAERLRQEGWVLAEKCQLGRRSILFTGSRASIGLQYDVVLLLDTKLLIPQLAGMLDIGLRYFHIAVGSESINGSRRRTLGINATINRSSIEWIDTGGRVRGLELVGVNGSGNELDLVEVKHGCIAIPNGLLRDRIGARIRS